MPSGNYRFYVDFEQTSVDGLSFGNQTNTLRVPMYIFIGTMDDYNKQVIGYDIINNSIDTNGKNTTLFKEVLTGIKKLINPLNTITVFKDIINEPLYNFEGKNTNVFDFNNTFYTLMKDVATTSDKLTDTKYIKYNQDSLNKKIARAVKDNNVMNITLENEEIISIELRNDTVLKLEEQLINISKSSSGNVTLETLMNTLQVPKNKNYYIPKAFLVNTVKNSGNIPMVIKGKFDVFYNNFDKVTEGEINSSTILQNETSNIKTAIDKDDYIKGVYNISGIVKGKSITNEINQSFSVGSQRYIIIISLSVFLILYYLGIIFLIKYLFKRNKNKKNNKKINDNINDTSNDNNDNSND